MGITVLAMATQSQQYWDQEYSKSSDEFDWYQQYAHLDNVLSAIESGTSCLVVGAGTSAVGPSLAKRGVNVTCIEQSSTAVNAMKARAQGCNWVQGDVTSMPGLAESSFDWVLDKALFDSLLCQEAGTMQSQRYLSEAKRVLKDGGKVMIISTGDNDIRKSYFANCGMECPLPRNLAKPSVNPEETVGGGNHYLHSYQIVDS